MSDSNSFKPDNSFRDSIATVDREGKRVFIHPTKPKGKFYNWRKIVGYLLLVLMILMPLIKINGNPLVMLNFIDRQFIIFGVIFWPQDTFLLLLMMLSFLVFIILFTVTFGRIWCGWACPQTIFLELIFRPIEYLIDGNAGAQKKLKKQAWNANKIFKRILKAVIFFIISLALVNVILWYFMGFDKWYSYALDYQNHMFGIGLIFIFTLVFFLIYWSFREQICIIACPYGRIQGVLLDPDSIVISYDYLRGEPRGLRKKSDEKANEELGDCVDCNACVNVCPTGIDIRNGTQLECVNCTACIDACDTIMEKYDKDPGLIRYASQNQIKEGSKFKFKPRIIAYTIVLIGLLTFFVSLLVTRSPIEANVLRTPNVLSQTIGNDSIQNIYNVKVVNKTTESQVVDLKLSDVNGRLKIVGDKIKVPAQGRSESVLFIILPKTEIVERKFSLQIDVYAGNEIVDDTEVTFISQ